MSIWYFVSSVKMSSMFLLQTSRSKKFVEIVLCRAQYRVYRLISLYEVSTEGLSFTEALIEDEHTIVDLMFRPKITSSLHRSG